MRIKPLNWSALVLLVLTAVGCDATEMPERELPALQGAYLGQKHPGSTPEVFAPKIISDGRPVASIAFAPDGEEIYFAKDTPDIHDLNVILFAEQVDGRWSEPRIAPFSGRYRDWNLNLSPDGNMLYFTSRRPLDGRDVLKNDNDIWCVERTNTGWGIPKNLGPPINTEKMDCYASVTRTGTLYYHGFDYDDSRGRADIYRSKRIDGHYESPENLGDAINSSHDDWDAFVAPDESYLIFASVARPDSLGQGDLYVSFLREDGSWTPASNLGEPVNSSASEICPSVSPDGKYLFYTSNRSGTDKVYWVDAQVIEGIRTVNSNQ